MTHDEMKAYAKKHPEVRWQFWNEHHNFWQTVRKGGTPQWKPDVNYRIANKYLRQAPQNDFDIVVQARAKMAKTREEIIARSATVQDVDDPYPKMYAVLEVLKGVTLESLRYDTTRRHCAALVDKLKDALK